MSKERVWVIAGSEHQFHDYVRDKPLNGDKKYSYVYRPETLRGFVNPHGVFIGSWKHRSDIIPILDMLIITTHENTDKLHKIRNELMQNASLINRLAAAQSSGVTQAAAMLAKAIDQEVLQQLIGKPVTAQTVFDIMEDQEPAERMQTWRGFVKGFNK